MSQFTCTFSPSQIAQLLEIPEYTGRNAIIPTLSAQHSSINDRLQPGIFKQICKVFPNETDVDRLLAISASLSYACRYDDQLELLDFDQKQSLISQTLAIFDNIASESNSANPEPVQRALELTREIAQTLEILMPNHFQAVLSLLREPVATFQAEAEFQRANSGDLNLYRKIRFITIGVKPLIRILTAGRIPQDNQQSTAQVSLTALEDCVISMCGLQNDLLGLHRDLEAGDLMSFPIVHAKSTYSIDLDVSVLVGIQEHNDFGMEALSSYHRVMEQGTQAEQEYAYQLFFVPTLSFKFWARESRYQAKIVPNDIVKVHNDSFVLDLPQMPTLSKAVTA